MEMQHLARSRVGPKSTTLKRSGPEPMGDTLGVLFPPACRWWSFRSSDRLRLVRLVRREEVGADEGRARAG